eukprot:COSAG02_NODE_1504_length_12250_cov_12.501934_6_plen_284_part_00
MCGAFSPATCLPGGARVVLRTRSVRILLTACRTLPRSVADSSSGTLRLLCSRMPSTQTSLCLDSRARQVPAFPGPLKRCFAKLVHHPLLRDRQVSPRQTAHQLRSHWPKFRPGGAPVALQSCASSPHVYTAALLHFLRSSQQTSHKPSCVLFTVFRATHAGQSRRSVIQTVVVDATPVDGQALACITEVGLLEHATPAAAKEGLSCVASVSLPQPYTPTFRMESSIPPAEEWAPYASHPREPHQRLATHLTALAVGLQAGYKESGQPKGGAPGYGFQISVLTL